MPTAGVLVQSMNDKLPAQLGRTPGLIGMRGPQPTMGGATLGIYTPFEALEPHQPQSERTMVSLVENLNRDDALLMCGYLNCVTSGSGPTEDLDRQRNAYSTLFTPGDAAKIDAWIREHRAANRITLFFRGQLLELMRWVARHANPEPGDGLSFAAADTRQVFVRAAFLAADLWSKRTFADKLTGAGTQEEALNRALGAFEKAWKKPERPCMSVSRWRVANSSSRTICPSGFLRSGPTSRPRPD